MFLTNIKYILISDRQSKHKMTSTLATKACSNLMAGEEGVSPARAARVVSVRAL